MSKPEFHHGPTVFINESRDKFIQDFQNKHESEVTG